MHLNSAARQDLAWWHSFLQIWNGVSILPDPVPSHYVTSDASGGWGCGAVYKNLWFQLRQWTEVSIAPKELAPTEVALWGPQLGGSKVCALFNNMAVVYAINKKSARDPALSRLLRIACSAASSQCQEHLCGCFVQESITGVLISQSAGIPHANCHSPSPTGAVVQPARQQHIKELDGAVEGYLGNCIAPSTRAAYSTTLRRLLPSVHCRGTIPSYRGDSMQICSWEGLKYRTIKSYLSPTICTDPAWTGQSIYQ